MSSFKDFQSVVTLLLLLLIVPFHHAFIIPTSPTLKSSCSLSSFSSSSPLIVQQTKTFTKRNNIGWTLLNAAAADDDDEEKEEEGNDNVEAKEEEEEKKEEEDEETKALKDEIASLEATLKSKRISLSNLRNSIDDFSEAGYIRKVAEMDQIRKLRDSAFSNNKYTQTAQSVRNFLPILDELNRLNDSVYPSNEFAKRYFALRGNFVSALQSLGMKEYTAQPGTLIDRLRFDVVEEVYSDDHARGMVVSPVEMGLEIEGNVMRLGKCVGSLGSEEEAKKRKEEEEKEAKRKKEEEAAAKAESEGNDDDEEKEEEVEGDD